ncbi:MAG: hypothetical protein OK455_09745 [Thaumarchaeota archaeon]|nr:hypothetical protein [Nitrososphaerota archaeon]
MTRETPLQIGNWTINSNGRTGTLAISVVSPAGIVSGRISIPDLAGTILGWWDEESQRLDFSIVVRVPTPPAPHNNPSSADNPPPATSPPAGAPTQEIMQVYVGFMFEDQVRISGVTGATVYTLAGYSENFGTGGTAQQQSFGWYAQIGVE